jgi:hypothetical protein
MLVTTTFTMPRCGMLGFDITAALIISILSVIWKSLTETREIVWKDEDVLQLYTDDVSETTEVRIIWMHKRCLSIDCLTLYSASWSILIAFEADKPCSMFLWLYPLFFKWSRSSLRRFCVLSSFEQIHLTRNDWLYEILPALFIITTISLFIFMIRIQFKRLGTS